MNVRWEIENTYCQQAESRIRPDQAQAAYMPTIRKEMKGGVLATDAISELFANRVVIFASPFDDASCTAAIAQLLYLDANVTEPNQAGITIYINSGGGSVTAGLSLYNTMQNIRSPITTIGMGMCASMGAFLLCTGEKGRRFAYPETTIMIHQPSWGAQGTHRNIRAHMKFGEDLYYKLIGTMAAHCNLEFEEMQAAVEEDNFLTAEQALKLGLIDKIVPSPEGKVIVTPRQPKYRWTVQ